MWSKYVCVPIERVFKIPDELTYHEAAAIPVNYISAYMMLFDLANLQPADHVLIHMAAGRYRLIWLVLIYRKKPTFFFLWDEAHLLVTC